MPKRTEEKFRFYAIYFGHMLYNLLSKYGEFIKTFLIVWSLRVITEGHFSPRKSL